MDPKTLLEGILADPDPNSDRVGVLANKLLGEYFRGYPIENLRPLLHSENERLLSTGLFVASELGQMAKSLISDVFPLLTHHKKQVRFMALDCIQQWAGPSDKLELASAVAMLDDAEAGVRWKAMSFLSGASRDRLQAALTYWEATEPKSTHVIGLQWLLGPGASSPEEVMTSLQSPDPGMRKYAMAAAARMSEIYNDPLLFASTVEDPEVKSFADRRIEQYKLRLAAKVRKAERMRRGTNDEQTNPHNPWGN